jgi:hydrogenase maturation protease
MNPPASKIKDLMPKTLVLGLGNPILTDDGVGIYVVREAASRLAHHASDSEVAFVEASVGGLRLLDVLAGYDGVILVDAIQTRAGRPGDVYRLHPGDLRQSLHSGSSHDLSLADALALGRRLGITLPDDESILILAVEVEDVLTFGEACTSRVAQAVPQVVDLVMAEIPATVDPRTAC